MPALVTAVIENLNGIPKDANQMAWAFNDDATDAGTRGFMIAWVTDFFNTNFGTHELTYYMPDDLADIAHLKIYDLAGHLDGSPHGSPLESFDLAITGHDSHTDGNQLAAVFTGTAGTYASTPAEGGTGPIPTPEQAQDWGAPATHMGTLRPKSRLATRIYFPLNHVALQWDGTTHNPTLLGAFVADAVATLTALKNGGSHDHGRFWSSWSRRNASLETVTGGWVDHGVKTRRKREFVPNARTTF